jgi:hypothetical protein
MNEFPGSGQRVRLVWDAGISLSLPVTRGLWQAERDWFRSLMSPGSGARNVLGVQDADFTLSAGGGFAVNSPALPHIAVRKSADAIYVFLGRVPRWADRAPTQAPAAPARPQVPADRATWVAAAPARPQAPVRVRLVWDAGISPPVTRGFEQAERDWFSSQDADFTLSTGDGFVVISPALPHIAVGNTADAVNVLLVPVRPHPFPPVKDFLPYHDPPFSRVRKPGPGTPVREPGFGFGPTG